MLQHIPVVGIFFILLSTYFLLILVNIYMYILVRFDKLELGYHKNVTTHIVQLYTDEIFSVFT